MNSKPWWQSKTIWTNILALIGSYVAPQIGVNLTGEEQVALLVVINLILRVVTKGAVDWTKQAAAPLLLCFLISGLCPLTSGCSNPQQTAYRTVAAIGVTANTAHNAWLDYAASGKAAPDDVAKVKRLWAAYCAAYALACDAGKTAAQTNDAAPVDVAVRALVNCEADMIALIKQLLPPETAAKL